MDFDHFLKFASEADIVGLWGFGFALMAIFATFAENRRTKRARIDRVGWMPWRAVFLACAMIAAGLLALAIKGIASG